MPFAENLKKRMGKAENGTSSVSLPSVSFNAKQHREIENSSEENLAVSFETPTKMPRIDDHNFSVEDEFLANDISLNKSATLDSKSSTDDAASVVSQSSNKSTSSHKLKPWLREMKAKVKAKFDEKRHSRQSSSSNFGSSDEDSSNEGELHGPQIVLSRPTSLIGSASKKEAACDSTLKPSCAVENGRVRERHLTGSTSLMVSNMLGVESTSVSRSTSLPDIANSPVQVLNLDILPIPAITKDFHEQESGIKDSAFMDQQGSNSSIKKTESCNNFEEKHHNITGSNASLSRSLPSLVKIPEDSKIDSSDGKTCDTHIPVKSSLSAPTVLNRFDTTTDVKGVIDLSPGALLNRLKQKLADNLFLVFFISTIFISFILSSPFFTGLFIGAGICSTFVVYFMKFLPVIQMPIKERVSLNKKDAIEFAMQSTASIKTSEVLQDKQIVEAWMLEYFGEMNLRTFDFAMTKTIFVRLDGPILRIQRPKAEYVAKRALHDEKLPLAPVFIHQRIIDLANAEVNLFPPDIPAKLRWTRRLPIVLTNKDSTKGSLTIKVATENIDDEKNPSNGQLSPKLSPSDAALGDFDFVEKEECQEVIYLFARSNRQKEQWYYLLTKQIHCYRTGGALTVDSSLFLSPNLSPLNSFFHRIFADSLSEKAWKDTITAVIERKLQRFNLPPWIQGFQMSQLEMGKFLPVISDVCETVEHNAQGLWWDMWLEYHGGMKFKLETKVNLMMLKKAGAQTPNSTPMGSPTKKDESKESYGEGGDLKSAAPASGGTSPENEISDGTLLNLFVDQDMSDVEMQRDNNGNKKNKNTSSIDDLDSQGSSKVFRMIDKFAHSKTVQYISEYKFIKKRIEAVSNTPLLLEVELERLAGRLQINIPPQPSDKLWYGFAPVPSVDLKARPFYGEREVKYLRITDWIETKLESEFHKVFTSPNFDDISVPFMDNDIDSHEKRLEKLKQIFFSRQEGGS